MPHFKNKLYTIQKVLRDQNTSNPVIVLKRIGKSKLHYMHFSEDEMKRIQNDLNDLPISKMKT
jgi:hypothetical protein